MAEHTQPSQPVLPDPGAPPPSNPALLGRYLATQWRRAFGLNMSQIDEWLYVGGEFTVEQWPKLHGRGVRAVLSLQEERADEFCDPHPERQLRLLVPDFHSPTVEQLHEAVAFLAETHERKLPTLIHCHAGVGRAPLTAAAFLVARGMSVDQAIQRLYHARPIIRLNGRQRTRLDEWEQLHKNQKG